MSHKGSPTPSAKPARVHLSNLSRRKSLRHLHHAAPASAKTPLKRTTPRAKKSPVKAVVNDDEEIDEVLCLYEKRCEHNDEERESCEYQVFVCVDCLSRRARERWACVSSSPTHVWGRRKHRPSALARVGTSRLPLGEVLL